MSDEKPVDLLQKLQDSVNAWRRHNEELKRRRAAEIKRDIIARGGQI